MEEILAMYYKIRQIDIQDGYFYYQNQLYFIFYVEHIQEFMEIYYCYKFLMEKNGYKGYTIVPNIYEDIVSKNCIVLAYHQDCFYLSHYLQIYTQPVTLPRIAVEDSKERWIHKIDCVKEYRKKYAYSFQHDQDMISCIYYYCGLAENSIFILNELLKQDPKATVTMTLSLKHPVENKVYQLLNPAYYTFSSLSKHYYNLLESQIIQVNQLKDLCFCRQEIYYLYARYFYASSFFDCMLSKEQEKYIQYYYHYMKWHQEIYDDIYVLISKYMQIPKISWL